MPLYDYRCEKCGHKQEHLVKRDEVDSKKCPKCDSDKYKRQVSSANAQFIGKGFYCTDFKNK